MKLLNWLLFLILTSSLPVSSDQLRSSGEKKPRVYSEPSSVSYRQLRSCVDSLNNFDSSKGSIPFATPFSTVDPRSGESSQAFVAIPFPSQTKSGFYMVTPDGVKIVDTSRVPRIVIEPNLFDRSFELKLDGNSQGLFNQSQYGVSSGKSSYADNDSFPTIEAVPDDSGLVFERFATQAKDEIQGGLTWLKNTWGSGVTRENIIHRVEQLKNVYCACRSLINNMQDEQFLRTVREAGVSERYLNELSKDGVLSCELQVSSNTRFSLISKLSSKSLISSKVWSE